MLTFAYAGPIIGVVAWNLTASLIGVICVYIFLHRDKFKKYKFVRIITKPLHGIIKKIALKRLSKKNTNKS